MLFFICSETVSFKTPRIIKAFSCAISCCLEFLEKTIVKRKQIIISIEKNAIIFLKCIEKIAEVRYISI